LTNLAVFPPCRAVANQRKTSGKRSRTAYSSVQLVELEKEFNNCRYLCRPKRIQMADTLKLSERQIKIWFQNRRMKYKKEQNGRGPNGTHASSKSPEHQTSLASPLAASEACELLQSAVSSPQQQHPQQQQQQQQQQRQQSSSMGAWAVQQRLALADFTTDAQTGNEPVTRSGYSNYYFSQDNALPTQLQFTDSTR
jgi:hypothetical protein